MNTREFMRFHYPDGDPFLVNVSQIRTVTANGFHSELLFTFDGENPAHLIIVKESFMEVELMLSQEAWTRDVEDRPIPVHDIRRAQHIKARDKNKGAEMSAQGIHNATT